MQDQIHLSEAFDSASTVPSSTPSSNTYQQPSARSNIIAIAQDSIFNAHKKPHINSNSSVFDPESLDVKEDIIRMIIQYLQDEGYYASSMTLQDESNVKAKNVAAMRFQLRRMKKAILEGDWVEVEKLCQKVTFKNLKSFLYSVYRQQFLEAIDAQEYQKSFALLQKRIKPLETYAFKKGEFKDLCYLLTCKNITDAPSFRDWNGVGASREALVDQFSRLLDLQNYDAAPHTQIPSKRLLHLLHQASLYQIECSRYHPRVPPRITTLLKDYECYIVPNAIRNIFKGHSGNTKCASFLGEEGRHIITGSGDNTLGIWDTTTGKSQVFLQGHSARIWDVASNKSGTIIGSASGDGTLRLWSSDSNDSKDYTMQNISCKSVLTGHNRDIYSVAFHPLGNHVLSGGYDNILRLYDIRTEQVVKTFTGHDSSIAKAVFNPHGNLIISGSKDATIRCWDIVSGVCVKIFSSHLGEVTSVDVSASGSYLLSSSKDNSNRLWDLRLGKPIKRYKGHQNTSKNFIRTSFGPREDLIAGGSEDGFVYLWDVESTCIVEKLGAQSGAVYSAEWSPSQSLLVSSSEDGAVRTWWYDPSKPFKMQENG